MHFLLILCLGVRLPEGKRTGGRRGKQEQPISITLSLAAISYQANKQRYGIMRHTYPPVVGSAQPPVLAGPSQVTGMAGDRQTPPPVLERQLQGHDAAQQLEEYIAIYTL